MRLPFRAAVVAPVVAALALTACAGDGEDASEGPGDVAASGEEGAGDDPSDAASGGEQASLPEPTDLGDGVAATVGDAEITTEELAAAVAPRGVEDLSANPQVVRTALQQLIQVELVAQQAESELGLDLDAVLTEEAIGEQADQFITEAGGEEAFAERLAGAGIDAEDPRSVAEQDARVAVLIDAVTDALVDQLPEDAVDEEGLRAEFEEDPSAYQSSDVAHILFIDEGAADGEEPDYDALEEEARAALERLEQGEDFGDLARELSDGPTGPQGGELGVQPRGQYVEPFSEAVYADSTEVGEVVGPVRTQFGVHLIRVNDIITPTVDEVVQEARRAAAAGQLQQFAAEAFEARPVVVDDDYGVWNQATASIEPA